MVKEPDSEKIRKTLIDMKNTSELMVDLAYSAVLFDNEGVAADVHKFEEKMDKLLYDIQLLALTGTHTKEDADRFRAILSLATAAEIISDAAESIADVVLRDIDMHPVLAEAVQESDETICKVTVANNSVLGGKTLGETRLATNTGMHIVAIKRGKEWIYGPNKLTKIQAKDTLIARGRPSGAKILRDIARGIRQKY